MSDPVPPLKEGTLNRGGRNREPMRPRPEGAPPATGLPRTVARPESPVPAARWPGTSGTPLP